MGTLPKENRFWSRYALRLCIMASFLVGMAGCGSLPAAQAPTIGEPKVSPSTPVKPGDEVGIGVEITNTDNTTLTYSWSVDGGKILRGDGSPSITYEAPAEPGLYNVTVEVKWGDQSTTKTASIKVEPAPTPQPQPTVAPATQLRPTEPPVEPTEPSAQQPTTEPPTQAPTASPITLTNMEEGQSYPCENLARGTYSPEAIKGHIWPLVFINGRFYPQDEGGGEPQMLPDGNWFSTVRFGDCNADRDVGRTFQLLVVDADEQAHGDFMGWLERGKQTNNWEGLIELPAGATEHLRIFVTRK